MTSRPSGDRASTKPTDDPASAVASGARADGRRRLVAVAILCAAAYAAFGLPDTRGAAGTILLGDAAVETASDSDVAGQSEAFRTTATATGALGSLTVYVAAGSAANRLVAGIYGDAAGHPGSLLASGSLVAPVAGVWNTVSLSTSPQITTGTAYWIAILSPAGSGTLSFRDVAGAGASETSSVATLNAVPATWTTGSVFNDGPLSAYGVAATVAPDTTPPSAPPTLTVSGVTPSALTLSWQPSTDDVGVAGYDVYLNGVNIGTTSTTSHAFAGLACETAYSVAVDAFDAAGNVSPQAQVAATTATCPPPGTPPPATTPTPVPAATVAGVAVGGGFLEASARQVLRTARNVVYIVAADDNPCQAGGSGVIRVEKGTGAQGANAAVPTTFTEQDSAHHPVSAGVGNCQFSSATSVLFNPDSRLDRSGTIHMAYIDTANGNVYYQTFATLTDAWGPRTIIGTRALTSSGAGWPRGGQVALTLDVNDVPHVVYASSGSANTLVYTSKVGGVWRPAVTVASGTSLMHPTLVTSLDGALQLAWLDNSLAAHATVRYARFDGAAWSTPETVSGGDAVVLANGDDDQGPSIATDLQSRPHVLFMDGTVNGSNDYVRMRVRTAQNTWTDDTPPGGAGGPANPAGTWFAHTPQNYVSSTGADFVFLGHDVNISPGGYQYQTGGPGNPWSAYATLDPRNKTNTTAGAPGLDGTASIRFDPLRDNNAGIIDVLYYDENDGTAGYPHHATIYYKAIVVGPPDTTPPSAPTAPVQTGATATSVTLGWNASTDNVAVVGYGLYNGTALVGSSPSTAGTIGGLTCGTTYTVGVDAYDAAGNRSAQATTQATTAVCDVQPPTVTLTAPAAGSNVTGAVAVTASASDDIGVVGVQFAVDGTNLGTEDTTAPYAVSWDSTTSASGPHTLTAVARDAAGNVTTSAPVGVTSQNQGPAFVKDLGTVTAVSTGGSLQLAVPAGGVAAGHTVVVWAEMSGSGGVTISSITDARGNSYTPDAAINNLGVNTMVGSGYIASPLVEGDKLTVTFSGSYFSLRVMRAAEFTGLSATGRLDQKATGTGSGTAPGTALAPATTQASELLVGAIGTSNSSTLSSSAGFTGLPAGTTSGSGVTRTVFPVYRIVTATGQYQAKGTLAAAATWSAVLATYH